jgi:hypothetical protein
MKKPFKQRRDEAPRKYHYITVNGAFYAGKSAKVSLVKNQSGAFKYLSEARAKEEFVELARRYGAVGAKVELKFEDGGRSQPVKAPQNNSPKVERRPVVKPKETAVSDVEIPESDAGC